MLACERGKQDINLFYAFTNESVGKCQHGNTEQYRFLRLYFEVLLRRDSCNQMNSTISEGIPCFSAENEVRARCCEKDFRSFLAGQ